MATELEIRVTAELKEIRAALTQLTGDIGKVTSSANAAGRGTSAMVEPLKQSAIQARTTATAVDSVRAGIASAVSQAKLLVGTLGAAALVKQLVDMADTATRLKGQLALVTKGQKELAVAMDETFNIAQRTRQSLESTVDLYARIARAGRTNQQETLALTETINQAVTLSFTTAQAGEAALFQLGQALGSGTLRGEELNSVLEQTPRLAQAIAKGLVELGKIKNPGDLRNYANQQGIAAQDVIDALRTQREQVAQEFTKLQPTVADAFTALHNAALRFVGDVNNSSGASRELAQAILLLAKNLGLIANLLVTGAKLWAAYYVAFRVLPAAVAGLAAAFNALTVSVALNTPAMRAAQAQMLAMTSSVNGARVATAAFSLQMNGTAIAAGSMATKLKAAGAVAFAAFAGWEIGTALKEQFLDVEQFGIALASGLTKAAVSIKYGFLIAWAAIAEGAKSAFNGVLSAAANMDDKLATFAARIPGVGDAIAGKYRDAAASLRNAQVETKGVGAATSELWAQLQAELAGIDQSYFELFQAAAKAREGTDKVTKTGDTSGGKPAQAAKAIVNQYALLKDAAERALDALDKLYQDAGVSIADYFRKRVQLQQAAIDADIAAQRQAADQAKTADERKGALTQIIVLERQRKQVGVDAAREQAKAEEDLADKLADVRAQLLEAQGQGAAARTIELEQQYKDLLKRLDAESDEAGKALVHKLINVEAAKAGLDQFKEEFTRTTGALSQLEQTTAAQVDAGLLSNATGEQRIKEARATALEQLRAQRQEVAALYEQYKDPDTLLHLQALDEQIALLSKDTEDWRGKLQDAATSSLTQFFQDLTDGSTTAAEAVRNLAVNFTKALADMAAQALAKKAIQSIFDAFSGGGDGEGGASQVATAAAAGLAYATPVTTAAGALTAAGGVILTGASAVTVAAAALQAAATTLLIANASSSAASVAHTGGVAGGILGTIRNVSPYLFAGAPRYHSGGIAGLAPNEVPAVLQKGEEVITKHDPRHRYNGGLGQAQQPKAMRFIFVDDQRRVADFLNSPDGEQVQIETIARNAGAIREILTRG